MAEEGLVQVSSGFVRAANTEALLEIAAGIDDVPVVVARRDLLGEVSEEQSSPGLEAHLPAGCYHRQREMPPV